MNIGCLKVQLHLSGNHSLKQKRRVIKSLQDRLKSRFNLSIAEVADQNHHQYATLGITYVNSEKSQVDTCLNKVMDFIKENQGMYYLTNSEKSELSF